MLQAIQKFLTKQNIRPQTTKPFLRPTQRFYGVIFKRVVSLYIFHCNSKKYLQDVIVHNSVNNAMKIISSEGLNCPQSCGLFWGFHIRTVRLDVVFQSISNRLQIRQWDSSVSLQIKRNVPKARLYWGILPHITKVGLRLIHSVRFFWFWLRPFFLQNPPTHDVNTSIDSHVTYFLWLRKMQSQSEKNRSVWMGLNRSQNRMRLWRAMLPWYGLQIFSVAFYKFTAVVRVNEKKLMLSWSISFGVNDSKGVFDTGKKNEKRKRLLSFMASLNLPGIYPQVTPLSPSSCPHNRAVWKDL